MESGILIVDKPQDWTSHDVVAKLRGLLGQRRIGHSGTLDPMATGVLPVFVGRATRAVEFATETKKEYIAGLKLGCVTDTQDITGTILQENASTCTREEVSEALEHFRGQLFQIPPMYSAIKIKGRKLYELARAGKEVERPARSITIEELELLEETAPGQFLLRVLCSKGTYVRTLCHDIGAYLGCGGCLSSLRRTAAAGFTIAQAQPLDLLLQTANPKQFLLPVADFFADYDTITIPPSVERRIRNGLGFSWSANDGTYRVFNQDGQFLMLGKLSGETMTVIKSFFEV